jgi:hypothetical protein
MLADHDLLLTAMFATADDLLAEGRSQQLLDAERDEERQEQQQPEDPVISASQSGSRGPAQDDLDLDVPAVRPALALEAHLLGDRDPDLLACGPQLERPTGGERKGDVRQALRSLSTRNLLLVVELGHAASLLTPPRCDPP